MAESTARGPVRRIVRIPKWRAARITWFSSRSGWVTFAGIFLILGILLADKGPILAANAAPSGADPGNWLSLAWGITGQSARLAAWAYPPLTFIVLRGILALFAPLAALKILGVLTWLGMGTAFWFVMQHFTQHLPVYMRFALALMFMFSGYQSEIFAWGGYPQLAGMAFLILALPFAGSWLEKGDRTDGLAATVFFGGVIFTHHLMTAMLPILWGLVFLWTWLHHQEARQIVVRRFLILSGCIFLLSLAALPIYWRYVSLLAGNPADTSGFNFQSLPLLISYLFRDATWLWIPLTLLALGVPFLFRRYPLSASVIAFTWGSLLCFGVLWEVRLLQGLFTGIAMGMALVLDGVWGKRLAHGLRDITRGTSVVLLAATLLVIIPSGQQQFVQASSFYRVVGNDILPGIYWLQDHTQPGDRVAASQTNPDLLGWWIEGLAGRPTFYATNLRWLSFKQEQMDARIANAIFDPNTPPQQLKALITENDIRWIFIDDRASANALTTLMNAGLFSIAYDDSQVTILKVDPNLAQAPINR